MTRAGHYEVSVTGYEPAGELSLHGEHTALADHGHVLLVKGAPDRLLERARREMGADGRPAPLDVAWWESQVELLSAEGLRVLAAARRDDVGPRHVLSLEDIHGLVFVGIVGIVDPPRPEAIESIATCGRAGIRVVMITGDHAGTAPAIGREMGIGDGRAAVTGTELEAAADEELQAIVRTNDVFARTSPEHKLRLVTALQANGEVVAMTGDGVDDAPALKRADVGVAMGIPGLIGLAVFVAVEVEKAIARRRSRS